MTNEPEEVERTVFNMTVANLKAIDESRNVAQQIYFQLRFDASNVRTLIDALENWSDIISPLYSKDEEVEMEGLFKEAFDYSARLMLVHANKVKNGLVQPNSAVRADDRLLSIVKQLKKRLYKISDSKGLGIKKEMMYSTKSTSNRYLASAKA